jgi:hypothetical protein
VREALTLWRGSYADALDQSQIEMLGHELDGASFITQLNEPATTKLSTWLEQSQIEMLGHGLDVWRVEGFRPVLQARI